MLILKLEYSLSWSWFHPLKQHNYNSTGTSVIKYVSTPRNLECERYDGIVEKLDIARSVQGNSKIFKKRFTTRILCCCSSMPQSKRNCNML